MSPAPRPNLSWYLLGSLLLVGLSSASAAAPSSPPSTRSTPARTLDAAEVQALEQKLTIEPEDFSARRQLLEYYSREQFRSKEARQARQRHVLWAIEHRPEEDLRGPSIALNAHLDGAAYDEGKKLWQKQVEAHPENAKILDHAASYLLLSDRDLAEDFWKKAEMLEPNNPQWPEHLAHLYGLNANRPGGIDRAAAAQALSEMEKARSIAWNDDFNYLITLAKMAFTAGEIDKARDYASRVLDRAPQHQGEWNYGNAIHDGNSVLGRVALRDGKREDARKFLSAAGKTPGSPQLNSFGPNMSLAREMAEAGEKEAVLAYFESCRTFWRMGRSKLDAWSAAVSAGHSLDFGANLNY